jgi:hypothetical protein
MVTKRYTCDYVSPSLSTNIQCLDAEGRQVTPTDSLSEMSPSAIQRRVTGAMPGAHSTRSSVRESNNLKEPAPAWQIAAV